MVNQAQHNSCTHLNFQPAPLSDPPQETTYQRLASFVFSLGVMLLLLSVIAAPLHFLTPEGVEILPSVQAGLFWFIGLTFIAGILCRFRPRREISIQGFAFGIVLLLCSDWFHRRYNLFPDATARGEVVLCALLALFFLQRKGEDFIRAASIIAPLLLIWCFNTQANGRLLFSDDHPSMLYRLILLRDNFPSIPFYNPLWNAGTDARDFFATGILNVYFLFFPLIHFADLPSVYNVLVMGLLFVFVPLCAYFSARLGGLPSVSASITSLLSLTTNLFWYRWCLKYGALGFVTSTTLIPLNLVLAARILAPDRELKKSEALLFAITTTLMLLWTPTGIVFLPVIFLGALSLRRIIAKRYVKPLLIFLLFINLPWVLLFISVSEVANFVGVNVRSPETHLEGTFGTSEAKPLNVAHKAKKRPITLERVSRTIHDVSIATNPLLLFLFFPGLVCIQDKTLRRVFALTVGWLLFMGTILAPLKPQLELDRMLLILTLVMCFPTSIACMRLLKTLQEKNVNRFYSLTGASLVCGMLIASIFSVGAIVSNRSLEKFFFAEETVRNLSQIIREKGGEGRTLFAGFVLHELSHGHIAPLAEFSQRPLVASEPVHKHWRYTDIIPASYRNRGEQGIEEYLNLMNATSVVAHEKAWIDYFSARPDWYELLWHEKRFHFFQRKVPTGGYFYSGAGEILEQSSNALTLRVDSSDAVIKFRYQKFLKSSECSLEPWIVSGEEVLTKLTNCPPGTLLTIKAKSGLWRLLS